MPVLDGRRKFVLDAAHRAPLANSVNVVGRQRARRMFQKEPNARCLQQTHTTLESSKGALDAGHCFVMGRVRSINADLDCERRFLPKELNDLLSDHCRVAEDRNQEAFPSRMLINFSKVATRKNFPSRER
jgi:hypothetical protein